MIVAWLRRWSPGTGRRIVKSSLLAWLILAGLIFGRFAEDAFPAYYLERPLIVATMVAVAIGAAASAARSSHLAVAAVVTLIVAVPLAAVPAAVIGSVLIIVTRHLAKRQLMLAAAVDRLAFPLAGAFCVVGLFNVVGAVDEWQLENHDSQPRDGPNIVLVLLDGYPRGDSLREHFGIDNTAFLGQLRQFGFDIYDDATSSRRWTHLTLVALLEGSAAGIPDDSATGADQRVIRRLLNRAQLPQLAARAGYEFTVVDAPVGHVTFSSGRHVYHGAVTNFEDRLLRMSVGAPILATVAPHAVTDSLRKHLDESIATVVDLTEPAAQRLVLAHLMAPHLPFLYGPGGTPLPAPPYWPGDQLFLTTVEAGDISLEYYLDGYPDHLAATNSKVLAMVSAMVIHDPDAVIVLFSDHGARHTVEHLDEWQWAFLAARTPGHPDLFGTAPSTEILLCTSLSTYVGLEC